MRTEFVHQKLSDDWWYSKCRKLLAIDTPSRQQQPSDWDTRPPILCQGVYTYFYTLVYVCVVIPPTLCCCTPFCFKLGALVEVTQAKRDHIIFFPCVAKHVVDVSPPSHQPLLITYRRITLFFSPFCTTVNYGVDSCLLHWLTIPYSNKVPVLCCLCRPSHVRRHPPK